MTSTPPPSSTLSKYPLSGTTDQSSGRYLPAAVTAFGNKSTTVGKSPIASSLATGAQHSQAANNTSSRIPADRSFTSLLTATNNESVSRRPTAAQQDSNNNTTQHQYQTTHIDPNTRSFRSSLATANQSATITSAAARAEALENELDRVKKRNQQLETDMVEMRREQHNHRLEREQERVAASQRHYQEIEIERDRVKQAREDDEHRHQEAIQAERRRTEEISSRCRNLEDQVSRLNLVIGDKDQQLELANKKSSDLEVKISDVMREMQTVVRTYEAKLSTMNQVLESRADEIDAAHAATKEAENVSDSLRRQIRDLEEKKADLQADNGKLEVAVQSAKQDFRIVQQELNEERDRRNREQNAIVSAAEKQRDEMRHQDDIIAELREELRKKAKEIHDLDLELNKTRSNNAELNSEIERVGREAQRWEKRAEDNGSEYHVQVLKCQDFEAAFERTKSDLREAEVRGVEASELITRLREHISELKDELTKAQALAESYKSQLSAVNFAHQQLRSQSAMIERCEHDLEAREKKIRELAQELHVAEEKGSMAQELVGHVKQLETELQSKAEYADTILGRLDSVKGALETARQDIIEKEAAIERLNLRIHEFEGALRERDDRVYVLEREVATKNLLEQNCAELEQNLSNRTRELEKSFEEIGLLKHRIMDLEQHQAEAQDYQVTIKRLDTERVVMHNEMESLKATINDRENEIRSLRMDVEERATDVEGKNVELNKMKRDLEAARRIEAERAALKDRVHTLENNIDETMNQLRNVQQQNESLHQDCSTTQQQLSQSRIATNEAREKLENTKRALDELQVENGRLHVLNDNFKRDYDKANIEKQNAQNKVQQYGNQIDQLRGQLNDLTAKESSVTHLAETTQAELRQKSIQVEDLSKQLQELRRQVAHREQTIGNLEEDNSQLRATSAKISVMEGKVSALERLVHDKEMEIDRISLLNRQQQDQLSSMSTELQQAERQVRAAQDVRRKASSLQDDLDEANDENATLKQQVSEKERVISQLHNQIKDMGSDIDGYKKRERNSESTIEQLEGEVRRLKICEGESQGLVTVLRSKDADIDNLRDQTRQQSQRIGELEEQLQRNQRVVHENAVLEARMKSRDETVTALEKEMNNRAQENRELTAEVEHLTQSMRKLQSTADSLKESRDIGERENKGLRDRIEFLMKGAKEDTIHAATEIETFKNVANESKAELAQQRERAHALQLQVARQQDQLSAAEKRYDVVAKELAAQKAEFNSMKLAFEERGNTINRLQENLSLEQRRAQGASDVVATLQSSANENALRTADERTEATKHIDRLERVVDDLKSQLNQRNTTLTERGRTLAMQEERLRDVEAELRRANEQKAVLQHRVTSLEDDIKVLQRTNDMATARRKAAELSLQEADEKLSEKELKYRELDRMSSFERMTHSDRENALRREADRLAATESQLRRRTHELESQLDEVRSSPGRSFAGQNNDFGSGSRSRTRY